MANGVYIDRKEHVMADNPRTIDNLGIDVSTQYAAARKELEKTEAILKEGKAVRGKTEIDVTIPYFESEFEKIYQTQKRNIPIAELSPPPRYAEQQRRVFTHQVLPSLGTDEKLDAQVQRIQGTVRIPESGPTAEKMSWEAERELQEQQKEQKVLVGLFINTIRPLDKDVIDINSRRGQYHKG